MMEVDTNPPDTIVCLLCRGAVTYIDNDSSAFFRHLKQEHSVHYDHHFLLSVTFFDDDSKKMVVQNFEENMERNKTEKLITDDRDITDLDDFEELDDEETLDEGVSEVDHEDTIEDDMIEDYIFKCNICANSFKSGAELKRHASTHTGPFPCNICKTVYSKMANLEKHRSNSHSEEEIDQSGTSQLKSQTEGPELLRDGRNSSTIKEPGVEINETGKRFKCEKCGQEFDLHNILLLHKLQHGESYKTQCEVCTTVFSSRGNLIKHINRKHKDDNSSKSPNSTDDPVQELIKKSQSSNSFHPVQELIKNSQTSNYVSDPVKTPFKNPLPTGVADLDINLAKEKENGWGLSMDEAVKNPESKDDTTVPPKCFQCKAQFLTSKQLNKHKSNTRHQIYPPQGDTTKHQMYPPQGDTAANIKKELIDVNQIKKEVYKGTGEDLKNIKKENLPTHNETENTDSKIMHNDADDTDSKIIHNDSGDTDSKIECKVCSKVFRTRKLLSGHNSKIHTPKPYSCEDCPKSFVDWLNLRRHAYQYHPANAKKTLDLLTKKTSESVDKTDSGMANLDDQAKHAADLKKKISEVLDDENDILIDKSGINSMRNRIGDDTTSQDATISFQSILANAMAKKNDSDDYDQLDIDTEESLECKICDKMFDNSAKLKRHKLIHNGDKPYACDVCDSSFNQRANLKRHMKSCHE